MIKKVIFTAILIIPIIYSLYLIIVCLSSINTITNYGWGMLTGSGLLLIICFLLLYLLLRKKKK
ncbi:MAG: hypothetical protein H6Q18_562 [Bacteroidetes bacterium]|nr:hypothetical protein [Bacteroidota bacterium]